MWRCKPLDGFEGAYAVREIDQMFPKPGAIQCHFKGDFAQVRKFRNWRFSPCNPCVLLAIRVGGDVAEWSKALPC